MSSMSNQAFHNNTGLINNIWYDSHKNLITGVLIHLGKEDLIQEVCNKFLGDKLKTKKLKDPNKPKRAKSGYLCFCDAKRDEVTALIKKSLKKNENIKIADVSKKLGSLWKNLSDKDKTPYNKEAEKDKERYNTEMEAYTS